MKMKYILTLMLLAIVTGTMAQKQLVILHTNDTHSTIFPLNVNLADTMKAGRGGFIRRVAMLESMLGSYNGSATNPLRPQLRNATPRARAGRTGPAPHPRRRARRSSAGPTRRRR